MNGITTIAAIAPIAWILLGAGIAMMPWFLYVYAGWEDLIGTEAVPRRPLAARRSVVLRVERADRMAALYQHRPRPAVRHSWRVAARPLRRGRRRRARLVSASSLAPAWRRRCRALILAALLTGVPLLALFDRDKFIHYFAVMWPWIALIAAIGFMIAVQSNWRIIRIAAIALLVLGCLDGVRAEVEFARKAAARASYAAIADRLTAHVPRDARVMGLPTWWFALEPHVRDYRSLTVPMFFLDIDDPAGRTFTERLDAMDADVLLLDQAMLDYVQGPRATWAKGTGTRNPGAEELERFVAARGARWVKFTDPAYGRFEIYYLTRTR